MLGLTLAARRALLKLDTNITLSLASVAALNVTSVQSHLLLNPDHFSVTEIASYGRLHGSTWRIIGTLSKAKKFDTVLILQERRYYN